MPRECPVMAGDGRLRCSTTNVCWLRRSTTMPGGPYSGWASMSLRGTSMRHGGLVTGFVSDYLEMIGPLPPPPTSTGTIPRLLIVSWPTGPPLTYSATSAQLLQPSLGRPRSGVVSLAKVGLTTSLHRPGLVMSGRALGRSTLRNLLRSRTTPSSVPPSHRPVWAPECEPGGTSGPHPTQRWLT